MAQSSSTEDRSETERIAYLPFLLSLIETGQILQAVEALHAFPAIDADSRPNDADTLALGWIAEECGLYEHAKELYGQIKPPKQPQPNSLFDLAQKRLKTPHADNPK